MELTATICVGLAKTNWIELLCPEKVDVSDYQLLGSLPYLIEFTVYQLVGWGGGWDLVSQKKTRV